MRRAVWLCAWALFALMPRPVQARAPMVLAAASLQESLGKAADVWAAKGHARPILSFASAAVLARQIVNGAPADLFLSADEEWMDYVAADKGHAGGWIKPGTRGDLLGNSLVLIAPASSPVRLVIAPGFPLARALGPGGRLAMGQPGAVPVGIYAQQALVNLKVWPLVAGRIAAVDSVRAAMALVARGEAPLGIVYATDARLEPRVRVVAQFPANSHQPIRYPMAALAGNGAGADGEAEAFRRFLLSGEGRAIFVSYGFTGG